MPQMVKRDFVYYCRSYAAEPKVISLSVYTNCASLSLARLNLHQKKMLCHSCMCGPKRSVPMYARTLTNQHPHNSLLAPSTYSLHAFPYDHVKKIPLIVIIGLGITPPSWVFTSACVSACKTKSLA